MIVRSKNAIKTNLDELKKAKKLLSMVSDAYTWIDQTVGNINQ